MARKSQSAVYSELAEKALNFATEAAQRRAIAKFLAEHGYKKMPKVDMTRTDEGVTVRIYTYIGTPAGDFTLITGPSVEAEIHPLNRTGGWSSAEPGVYVKAAPAPERVAGVTKAEIEKDIKQAQKRARSSAKAIARGTKKTAQAIDDSLRASRAGKAPSKPSFMPGPMPSSFDEFFYEPVVSPTKTVSPKITADEAKREGADAFTRGGIEYNYPTEVENAGQEAAYRKGWQAAQKRWSEALRVLTEAVPAWQNWDPEPIEDLRDYDREYDSLKDMLLDIDAGDALRTLDNFRLGDATAKKLLSAGEIAIRNLTPEGSGMIFRNMIDSLHDFFKEVARDQECVAVENYANAADHVIAEIRRKAEIGGVRADEARAALDIIDSIGMSGFIRQKQGHPDFEVPDFGKVDFDKLERDALQSNTLLPYKKELTYIRDLLDGVYAHASRPSKTQVQAFTEVEDVEVEEGEDDVMMAKFAVLLDKALG